MSTPPSKRSCPDPEIKGGMDREVISTANAPAAIGPYSQAIKANGFIFVSGCLGLEDGALKETVEDQTAKALQNMAAILEAGGSSMAKVCKVTCLMNDMGDFAKMNGVYATFFPENPPARAAFAVKTLPLNALVEIEAIALV